MAGLLRAVLALVALGAGWPIGALAQTDSIAMHGVPALSEDFVHLPYADPSALKGGTLTQAVIGTFDSTNPFIVKGQAAAGIREIVYESLMKRSLDEPFTLYGLLADRFETSEDRAQIDIHLRPDAHFSDGVPVTSEDIAFSLEVLRRKGRPNYREYYGKVLRIVSKNPQSLTIMLDPKAQDRELPLIIGLMPVLPKHVYAKQAFDRTSLDIPIGSGAYRVASLEPGRRIVYRRDPQYWGASLAVNRGFNNFDTLRFEYFRDETSAFEAFKAGLIDLWLELDATRWAEVYRFNAMSKGDIGRAEIPSGAPSGMYAFVYNCRKPPFQDPRVRRALTLVFDFPQVNRTLLQGAFQRIQSYFDHSDLAANGPAGAAERGLLGPFANELDPAIMEAGWIPPAINPRENRRAALGLLREAGFVLKGDKLVDSATGQPFAFELLITNPAEIRIALAWKTSLSQIGVNLDIRFVDSAQFEMRRQNFEFDVTSFRWTGTLSPGNEQMFRWGSDLADSPGSYNVAGIKSAAADAMIRALLKAESREDLRVAVRALDRVLLSGNYVMPLFYMPSDRVAYRADLRRPKHAPLWGFDPLISPLVWWRAGPR